MSILAAFIGALAGGFLAQWLLYELLKPRLHIDGIDLLQKSGVKFFRLLVTNGGRRGATNCQGLITIRNIKGEEDVLHDTNYQHSILDSGFFERGQPIEKTSLCWAVGQSATTLNPKTPAALDVLRVDMPQSRNGWRILIPSEVGWNPLRVLLRAKTEGSYDGEIWVTAENADPAHCNFAVRFSPDDVVLELVRPETP